MVVRVRYEGLRESGSEDENACLCHRESGVGDLGMVVQGSRV